MNRIPLTQRLGTTDDTTWLILTMAGMSCDTYYPALGRLEGNTANYIDCMRLAVGRPLGDWLGSAGQIYPELPDDVLEHVMYRSLIEPYKKLREKGEKDHE